MRSLLVWSGVLFVGCAGNTDTDVGEVSYYADIEPLVVGRCSGCHQEGNIGPFALTNYKEVYDFRERVADSVAARRMPPWDADPLREYQHSPALTDDQIATIQKWVEAGAPEGDPSKKGTPLPVIKQGLSRIDLTIGMVEPYHPTVAPDEYRCFIIDWPMTSETYVTGLNVKPGSATIDHHVAAFLVSPNNVLGQAAFDGLAKLEAEDPKPGYTCFGGPAGESDLQIPAMQIGSWAPGQGGGDYPSGTGIRVPVGSKIVLQVHYNIEMDNKLLDKTEVEIKLDPTVTKRAIFVPWLDVGWVGGKMNIPAFESDVMHQKVADPMGFFSIFADGTNLAPGFRVHSAMLHMHKLGKKGLAQVVRQDGRQEPILSISDYDFQWQRLHELVDPIDFAPGDQMQVQCHFDNSQERNGGKVPQEVNWGEGTGEEMCVANLYISEL